MNYKKNKIAANECQKVFKLFVHIVQVFERDESLSIKTSKVFYVENEVTNIETFLF